MWVIIKAREEKKKSGQNKQTNKKQSRDEEKGGVCISWSWDSSDKCKEKVLSVVWQSESWEKQKPFKIELFAWKYCKNEVKQEHVECCYKKTYKFLFFSSVTATDYFNNYERCHFSRASGFVRKNIVMLINRCKVSNPKPYGMTLLMPAILAET